MNIDQLQCFLTVADTLNFARAAEQLHVTQPAVTQQIHALERELGVPLFRRTTRTVRITEEGLAFLTMPARSWRGPSARGCAFILPILKSSARCRSPARAPSSWGASSLRWKHWHTAGRIFTPGCRSCPTSISSACWKKATWTPPWPFTPNICASPAPSTGNCAGRGWSAPCAGITRWPDRNAWPLRGLPGKSWSCSSPNPDGRPGPDGLLTAHPPKDLYFCETPEATGILVQAGFGVALLPELLAPRLPDLKLLVLQQTEPVSFGVYCRAQQSDALLKDLIRSLRQLDWPLP